MERLELKEVQKLEGHTDRVWSLDWNPATGHAGVPLVFASCSGDKTGIPIFFLLVVSEVRLVVSIVLLSTFSAS